MRRNAVCIIRHFGLSADMIYGWTERQLCVPSIDDQQLVSRSLKLTFVADVVNTPVGREADVMWSCDVPFSKDQAGLSKFSFVQGASMRD